MKRTEIDEETCELMVAQEVSVEEGYVITFHFSGMLGREATLSMDNIGANALRIGIASLLNIPPLVLPKSADGELQCTYPKIHYHRGGEDNTEFEKELSPASPLGQYHGVDDGMLVYLLDGSLVFCFDCKESALEKDRLVIYVSSEQAEAIKHQLDRIFPFNRFEKRNRLSYGYFKSGIGEKEGQL